VEDAQRAAARALRGLHCYYAVRILGSDGSEVRGTRTGYNATGSTWSWETTRPGPGTREVDIAAAVSAYTQAALWSSPCNGWADHDERCEEGCCESLLSIGYVASDIAPDSRASMAEDVRAFVSGCEEARPDVFAGIAPEQIGHDFWLTRNGHGAGFWDRGLGERGQWLTDMAKPYGEAILYVGDDGRVHYAG
jgi:hypothetical protein